MRLYLESQVLKQEFLCSPDFITDRLVLYIDPAPLSQQVRALALSKYGGVEELESARDGSLQRKTERRLKRRRKEEDMVFCLCLIKV